MQKKGLEGGLFNQRDKKRQKSAAVLFFFKQNAARKQIDQKMVWFVCVQPKSSIYVVDCKNNKKEC